MQANLDAVALGALLQPLAEAGEVRRAERTQLGGFDQVL
jgi:hypothetical protein